MPEIFVLESIMYTGTFKKVKKKKRTEVRLECFLVTNVTVRWHTSHWISTCVSCESIATI